MRPLRTWFCAHDWLRHRSPGHLRLRCSRCGLETPGWRDDDLPKPRVLYAAPVRRKFKIIAAKKRRTA